MPVQRFKYVCRLPTVLVSLLLSNKREEAEAEAEAEAEEEEEGESVMATGSMMAKRYPGTELLLSLVLGWEPLVPMSSSPKTLFTKRFGNGILIHLVHTAALLATLLPSIPIFFGGLVTAGILAFSGTCYTAAYFEDRKYSFLGTIRRLAFIAAWGRLAFLRISTSSYSGTNSGFWVCEFNKATMVGSWGIVPRMLVFFGFEI
ncbi:hypothetical protein CK203_111587 [Vitis vinifera]|uniref:Uncharacterized protein n=1 Tax=Vitis vinifera TaxID=29760 RepID=A0A438FDT7_VITVI|nr:hypothetical protein CK203_111587 [Vitis vinifera]